MFQNDREINKTVSSVVQYLITEGNYELAQLLKTSDVSVQEIDTGNRYGEYQLLSVFSIVFSISIEDFRNNRHLLENYEKTITEVMLMFLDDNSFEKIASVKIKPIVRLYLNWSDLNGVTKSDVLSLISLIKNIMISVATGGQRIQERDSEYQSKYKQLSNYLKTLGAVNPNIFAGLWDWYGRWSQPDLSTYQSRRQFIYDMYQPLIEDINSSTSENFVDEYEPTGWERVDRSIYEMKKILSSASNEEQFQTIGVIGREAIITVAQQVYNPDLHSTQDGISPSETDAKRMLDAYIIYRLPGKTNDELRKFARSSLDLANKITHDRTANYEKAEMCITAVSATVSIIHSLSKSE